MATTPDPLPQDLIESWRQAQSDLDNRVQIAEATLGKLTNDSHGLQHKVQRCKYKYKNHPYDDGSQVELEVQHKDYEEKESGKVAQIQAHLAADLTLYGRHIP